MTQQKDAQRAPSQKPTEKTQTKPQNEETRGTPARDRDTEARDSRK